MRAWLKNAVELLLWWWIARPTSKMERRLAEDAPEDDPHRKRGRVYL